MRTKCTVGTTRKSRHHWDALTNQRKYLDEMANALHIKTYKDWTQATYSTVRMVGRSLLSKYGDCVDKMLASVYPEFLWCSED